MSFANWSPVKCRETDILQVLSAEINLVDRDRSLKILATRELKRETAGRGTEQREH